MGKQHYNIEQAAKDMGVSRRTLYYWLARSTIKRRPGEGLTLAQLKRVARENGATFRPDTEAVSSWYGEEMEHLKQRVGALETTVADLVQKMGTGSAGDGEQGTPSLTKSTSPGQSPRPGARGNRKQKHSG